MVYWCIWYVIMCRHFLSAVDSLKHREHTKHLSLSRNTFMTIVKLLTIGVRINISESLPNRFAIVFDRQTTPDTVCVQVIVSFLWQTVQAFKRFLALSLRRGKRTQSGNEHIGDG